MYNNIPGVDVTVNPRGVAIAGFDDDFLLQGAQELISDLQAESITKVVLDLSCMENQKGVVAALNGYGEAYDFHLRFYGIDYDQINNPKYMNVIQKKEVDTVAAGVETLIDIDKKPAKKHKKKS